MPWEKRFDKEAVLARAVHAFWANGYDGTGMADLLEQMGIQKGSFYATFGSKHQVYLDILKKYVEERYADIGAMAVGDTPLAELRKHFEWIAEDAMTNDGPLGCLIANAAVELAPKDTEVRAFVQKTFAGHAALYRDVLDAAKRKGELPTEFDSLRAAHALLALVLGIRVLSRAGMPPAVILAVRDQALALISPKSAHGL